MRTHPIRAALALVVLLAGCGYAWNQVRPFVGLPDGEVSRTLPEAPRLTAEPGETIYRIDATESSATYAVAETIVGRGAGTAEGTTQAIAGDIALNRGRPARSRVGDIVIDLRQLRSDNSLRDRRLRADFLASDDHPLARFATTSVEDLPASLPESGEVSFTLAGDLTVKETTLPAEWDVTGHMVGDELTATATTTIAMSDYEIGPISIAGLVRTEDEVTLTLELVAADPTKRDIPTELPPLPEDERATGGPSFARAVQPILEANCASCHNEGQIGSHVLGLDTAGDAAEYADGISVAVNAGYMPPWPASDEGIPLRHPRTLSDEDIATVKAWADAGAPLDVAARTPLEPVPDADVPTPRTDLALKMAEPYAGSIDNPNDYRCFTLDPGFTEPTYMTGYSFVPDEMSVVHHALVYKVDAEAHQEAMEKEGEGGRPGWECYVGTGLRTAPALDGGLEGKSDLVAGWVPGQRPLDFGDDRGFLFEPGDVLIAQIHYHYDHADTPADQSELRLQLAPDDAEVRALEVANPIAPVEIPCPEGADDGPLCDRDAALERILEDYDGIAAAIPGAVLEACDREIEEYAGQTDGIGSTSCDYDVHGSGEIIDVLGHMHELGRSFRMTLNPGTPGEKVLLDIPTWNFDWQLNYQPVEEIRVEEGDTLRIECTWDRGLRYDEEPKYLLFAEGTEDEMCFSTYTLLPDEETRSDEE
ncbi:MAG TPA: YceI family protein [Acidimicrobiales bacterium]|nr:YceI family protein [Acidimicrobiales bacterium]